MPGLVIALFVAAVLVGAACSAGGSHTATPPSAAQTQSPPTFGTPVPLPPGVGGWNTFASTDYGYSLRYPPSWFDLGGGGAPSDEQYFSNRKDAGSPLSMGSEGVFAGVSANCQYWLGPNTTLISQADVVIGSLATARYVVGLSTPDGNFVSSIATIKTGVFCYRIYMLAFTLSVLQSNLADFDLMLASVRFSTRKAPVVTPIETQPPTH
jgi:hypothetical protein